MLMLAGEGVGDSASRVVRVNTRLEGGRSIPTPNSTGTSYPRR